MSTETPTPTPAPDQPAADANAPEAAPLAITTIDTTSLKARGIGPLARQIRALIKNQFGTITATADAPCTGYITVLDSTGTARKLMVMN